MVAAGITPPKKYPVESLHNSPSAAREAAKMWIQRLIDPRRPMKPPVRVTTRLLAGDTVAKGGSANRPWNGVSGPAAVRCLLHAQQVFYPRRGAGRAEGMIRPFQNKRKARQSWHLEKILYGARQRHPIK